VASIPPQLSATQRSLRNSPEHIQAVLTLDLQFNRELNEIKLAILERYPYMKADDLETDPDWRFVAGKLEERRREAFLDLKSQLVDAADAT
jgi:hypothetical protein